jgi:ATP-binding cassette, subfamily B, multidrug efflux pump
MFSFFEKLIRPFNEHYTVHSFKGIFDFFGLHTQGIKKYLMFAAFFAASTAGIEVYLFNFLGSIVDSLSAQSPENFWSANYINLIKISVVLIIFLPIVTSTHSMLNHQTLIGNFPTRILFNTHLYLIKQNIQFYHNEAAGKISAKIIQLSTAARVALLRLVDVFVYASVFLISMAVMLAKVDLILLVPIIIWFTAYVVVISFFVPRLKNLATIQAEARSDMVGKLVDTYTNIVTVKLFSHSSTEKRYAESHMGNSLNSTHTQMRFVSKIIILIWILNSLLIFSTGALSFWLWSSVAITTGAVAATIAVVLRVYTISHWIMWETSALFENIGIINDGLKLFSSTPKNASLKKELALTTKKYNIEFENIHFGFNPDKDVIQGLTLNIAHGEKVGIVGRSGSGKSTLIKLLLQFYNPNKGSIFIGEQDIADLSQESLLQHIGVVAQDIELLNRSLRENLIYGKENASEEEIIAATKVAKAHDFILELVDNDGRKGYNAYAGERGVKLSGGQRQRIALARAILKNAPILIFDEATSALDSEVESQIMHNLESVTKDKTVIVIAHRLATLAHLDRIIVLDKGKIAEQGTHSSLIEQRGIYAKLWDKQSTRLKTHNTSAVQSSQESEPIVTHEA